MKESSTGLQARLAAAVAITALLAVDDDTALPRIGPGFPQEHVEDPREEYFPQLRHSDPQTTHVAAGIELDRIALDLWTWDGDRARRDELTRLLLQELDGRWWYEGAVRLHVTVLDEVEDFTGGDNTPHQRVIPLSILASRES